VSVTASQISSANSSSVLVFEAQLRAGGDERLAVALELRDGARGDGHDGGLVRVEDVAALRGRGGIVEMEDGVFRAAERLERARDQVFAALAEHLDGDIVGNAVFLDEAAGEIKLDLRGRREADLDLLEADLHEQLEEFELLLDAHGLGEGLVAIAQVDAAPDGRVGERAVGPLPVGQGNGREWAVFGDRWSLHGNQRKRV
jgi:hypothetical protein